MTSLPNCVLPSPPANLNSSILITNSAFSWSTNNKVDVKACLLSWRAFSNTIYMYTCTCTLLYMCTSFPFYPSPTIYMGYFPFNQKVPKKIQNGDKWYRKFLEKFQELESLDYQFNFQKEEITSTQNSGNSKR